jgi:hypothetical protein
MVSSKAWWSALPALGLCTSPVGLLLSVTVVSLCPTGEEVGEPITIVGPVGFDVAIVVGSSLRAL